MTDKTLDYLERAKKIHNGKYDYSLIKDIQNNTQKLEIICPTHGVFLQNINSHVHCSGECPKCQGNYMRTTEEWIEEAKIKHNNRYDYSQVEYKGNKKYVCIICSNHGEFWQTAKEHLTIGTGCPKCKKNYPLNTKTFIEKARAKHGLKYNYDLVDYKGNEVRIKIICPKHGLFEPTPHGHLAGYGCKKCSNHVSKPENDWLNSLGIDGLLKQHVLKFPNQKYIVDGFDPKTNTVYEFHGDYFHGNPLICDWYSSNQKTGKLFGELYAKTIEKEEFLRSYGYNVISIWESQWNKLHKKEKKTRIISHEYKIMNRISFIKQWEMSDDEWNFSDMRQMMIIDSDKEKLAANKLS